MNYKELLRQEILKRTATDESDRNSIRGMIDKQEAIADIPAEYRQDLSPGLNFVSQLTGIDVAGGYKAPESAKDSFRRALHTRIQSPKAKALESLQMGLNAEGGGAAQLRLSRENQRQREAMMNSEEGKAVIMNKKLQSKVQKYQDLVNKYGFEVAGANRAEIDGAYRELQIAYKNAAKLGVIAGPDMMLIEGIAPPSSGPAALWQNTIKGGKEGVNRSLNQLKASRQADIDTSREILNSVFNSQATTPVFEGMFSQPKEATPTAPQPTQANNSIDLTTMSEEQLKRIAGGMK